MLLREPPYGLWGQVSDVGSRPLILPYLVTMLGLLGVIGRYYNCIFGYRNSKQNECDTNKTNLFTHHDLVCMPVVINAKTNLSTCHKSELMNSNHYIYYLISLKAIKFNPVSNLDKLRPCPSTMDQICLKLNNNFHKT